ncbi:hypothetical protein [Streptomyces sp. CRN 30]|uniref:hypothetical protein n=1 Tax=Streptomyces sp. CRN 30 TaxID=3075613 RepID=UPI002A81FD64|nr:hypothetical protein [Streptomyces sp. CRN 30]
MIGIALTVHVLHRGEWRLAHDLMAAADRHRAEHEVRHVAHDLARWSHEHVQRLAAVGAEYGIDLDGPAGEDADGVLAALRRETAGAPGQNPDPGLLLLRDLRELHLAAAENSLHWEMLAQAAQAARDSALLSVVSDCHPRTLRQMRWTNTMIKNLSPQILTAL